MPVLEDRLPWIDHVTLDSGSHPGANGAACVMEAVSYVAGEPWSDHPACASPVITSFLVSWNDAMNEDDRQMLKPFITRVVGTRTTKKDEETRSWLLVDWLVRECAPAWLRLAGLTAQAELLESLAPLTDAASASKAQPALDRERTDSAAARAAAWDAARDAARVAAWDAARDAARAAAWDAAWVAARDAAWDAARVAAWVAAGAVARDAAWVAAGAVARDAAWVAAGAVARDAAGNAAGDTAWDAARDALESTVKQLQQSALLLLDRLIEVGRA